MTVVLAGVCLLAGCEMSDACGLDYSVIEPLYGSRCVIPSPPATPSQQTRCRPAQFPVRRWSACQDPFLTFILPSKVDSTCHTVLNQKHILSLCCGENCHGSNTMELTLQACENINSQPTIHAKWLRACVAFVNMLYFTFSFSFTAGYWDVCFHVDLRAAPVQYHFQHIPWLLFA